MTETIRREAGHVIVECVVGDITRQADCDAVVNAANAYLTTGGGVAGALHRAAGPGLAAEGRPFAPIPPGEAVVTSGHDLPNRWVIHCLGPVYGRDQPADRLLASCYGTALSLAGEKQMRSVAFPALSTGAFGYPMAEAAKIALETVCEAAPTHPSLGLVRFVLYDERAWRAHAAVLEGLGRKNGDP